MSVGDHTIRYLVNSGFVAYGTRSISVLLISSLLFSCQRALTWCCDDAAGCGLQGTTYIPSHLFNFQDPYQDHTLDLQTQLFRRLGPSGEPHCQATSPAVLFVFIFTCIRIRFVKIIKSKHLEKVAVVRKGLGELLIPRARCRRPLILYSETQVYYTSQF